MDGSFVRLLGAPTAVVAAVTLVAACSGPTRDPASTRSPAEPCADLHFRGQEYDEWRTVDPPRILQEVGNATYPACNAAGDDLDGFGATDVWLLPGADLADAVIGLREGTHTYVVFVRVGVDPDAQGGPSPR